MNVGKRGAVQPKDSRPSRRKRYLMITAFFLGFVALMTAVIVALSARYWNGGFAFGVLTALCAWVRYVGAVGSPSSIESTAVFPPGIALIFVPLVAFLDLFIVRVGSSAGARGA